jgi:predicted ATPase/DNA-binding SARP family transcriptional activator
VLGPIEGWAETRQVRLRGPRQLGLFALLALNANHAVASDTLIDTLWGEARQGAGKNLQMTVARIRKALAEAGVDAETTLRTVGRGYLLGVAPDQLDHERFAQLATAGQRALEDDDPAHAGELLGDALALWRGPPLTEVGFDDFAQTEIRRLQELRLLVFEARADAVLLLGRHAELVGELNGLLAQHPDRERLAGQLMLALYRCGRQGDALDIFQRVRVHLLEEVGLTPGPALQQLQQRVLDQDPSLMAPTSPPSPTATRAASIHDPGENSNLPLPGTTLIGREQDIESVSELVEAQARLITLTGSGGVGKTRLAIETARRNGSRWRDGVRFAELAPLADPDLVGATVAAAVEVPVEPGSKISDLLASGLADRELLLVVDNCEHVLAATGTLIEHLVRRCPRVSVLATSREPLQLEQEVLYRVPSLSVPADGRALTADQRLEQAGAEESVRLLVARGRARNRSFELTARNVDAVVAVCRHLDGIPLAIELAASRLGSISVEDLSARLDQQHGLLTDRSRHTAPRHQTLTALLDWSYELLSPSEQSLFARLAVFAGGFDLDAAEQISSENTSHQFEIADRLAALVEKSLVQADEREGTFRYRMLMPIREYAGAKLAALGAGEVDHVRREHRDYFLAFAETLNATYHTSDRRVTLDQLDTELDNLRVAQRYSLQDPDPEPGLRLVIALARFSRDRGHVDEHLRALKTHLARPESAAPTRLRCEALRQAGTIASLASSIQEAVEYETEALAIGRLLGDDEQTARALNELGYSHYQQEDYDAALHELNEALSLARQLDNPAFTAGVLISLGEVQRERGEDAAPSYAEALKLHRQTGNDVGVASALGSMGDFAAQNGDLVGARAHLKEALDILIELDIPGGIAVISSNLARVNHQLGDDAAARPLALDAARRAHVLQMLVPSACSLLALAPTITEIDPILAAGLYGAADQLAAEIGVRFETLEAQARATGIAELQQRLSETSFRISYNEGQRGSHRDLIERAAAAAEPESGQHNVRYRAWDLECDLDW